MLKRIPGSFGESADHGLAISVVFDSDVGGVSLPKLNMRCNSVLGAESNVSCVQDGHTRRFYCLKSFITELLCACE